MVPESKARILVVDGNPAAANAAITQCGARPYGTAYADLLRALAPGIECVIVHPCEQGAHCLPTGQALSDFDGVVWTGSSLHVYQGGESIENQIALAREVFAAGRPVFGSCWGMQLCVTALGGKVRVNPRKRELGVAEGITRTAAGKTHAMLRGRPARFSALTAHLDDVEELPAAAQLLAGNPASRVQALAVEAGGVDFWGVQYHPEMNHATVAAIMLRLRDSLLREGLYPNGDMADAAIEHVRTLDDPDATPQPGPYAAPELRTLETRALEIRNWLEQHTPT